MGRTTTTVFATLLAWTLSPAVAHADVVRPPPSSCPPGHEPRTAHAGPYCQPPLPTSCPAGHIARVYRDEAYCEPPPPVPCPPGSEWSSRSATDTYCVAAWPCSPERACEQQGATCRETSFCVRWRGFGGRRREAVVSGSCDATAPACPKGEQCMTETRCVSGDAPPEPPPTSTDFASPPPPPSASTAPPPVEVVPNPGQPAPTPGTSGCAGCATAPGPDGPLPLAGLALALLGLRRRRRLRR